MILATLCKNGFEKAKPESMGLGVKILERSFENCSIVWSITQVKDKDLYGICISTKNKMVDSPTINIPIVINELSRCFQKTSKNPEVRGKVLEKLTLLSQSDIDRLLRSLGNGKPCTSSISSESKDDEYLEKTEIDSLLNSLGYLDLLNYEVGETSEDDETEPIEQIDTNDRMTEEEIIEMMSVDPEELGFTLEFTTFDEKSLIAAVSKENIELVNQSILKLLHPA